MGNQRSLAQDAAKGIMMIAVVFFHSFMLTFENYVDAVTEFNFFMALMPFLIGSFFFYTGYNYVPNNRSYGQNIARRAKQLLLPMVFAFVISSVLIGVMELAFHHNDPIGTFQALGNSLLYGVMSEPMARLTGFPSGPNTFELILALGLLWFLYTLFICSVFFFLLVKHTNKSLPTLISVVAGLLILAFVIGQFIGPMLPYSVQCYPVVLALMLVGAYLRQSNFLDKEIKGKKAVAIVAINALIGEAIIIGVCLFCHYRFGTTIVGALAAGQFDAGIKGFDAFVSFGFGVIGTYVIHYLCRLLIKIPGVGVGLRYIGRHSAIFYLFHPVALELLEIAIFQKRIIWGRAQSLFYVVTAVILLVGVCLLIDWIGKKRKEKALAQASERGENS